jgi:hypothetical protein
MFLHTFFPFLNVGRGQVGSKAEVDALLAFALKRRAQGATDCNAHSSRSHLIVQVDVTSAHAAGGEELRGRLHLVSKRAQLGGCFF